jgi:hypothetical protein
MMTTKGKRLTAAAAAFILLFCAVFPAATLELKEGRIKLNLNEKNGKFSAYYEKKAGSGDYIPLFFARDPRTTGFGFLAGNRIYSMGESSGFSLTTGKEQGGGYFLWKSSAFTVKQSFRFIRSEGSTLADGFTSTITITNVSDRDQTIGVHYLFDTYLGEESSRHFTTDSGIVLKNETEYESVLPIYWLSPSSEDGFQGLQGMVQGRGISIPDRLVFANWKRLQENIWNFNVQSSRNFNMLPYSVNDSAVCYYFLPKKVEAGGNRELTFAFGAYGGGRFSASGGEGSSEIQALYDKAVDTTSTSVDDIETLLKEDLTAVNDLIAKIDELMDYPDSVTEEDLNVLRQILATLNQRKGNYQRR